MSNLFQQLRSTLEKFTQGLGETDPDHPLYRTKDASLVGEEANHAYKEGDLNEAIERYTEALKIKPNDRHWLFERARAYMRLREYDKALLDVSRIVSKSPYDLNVLQLRALIYSNLNLYHNAIADLTYVINSPSTPDPEWTYGLRAYCAFRVDHILAIHDYTYVIEKGTHEKLQNLYHDRGKTYLKLGDMNLALADFLKAIEINDAHVTAYQGCASVYYQQKNYDDALKMIERCIELEPDKIQYYLDASAYLSEMGKIAESLVMLEKALEQDPYHWQIHNHLGWWYPHVDELDKAMHYAERAVDLSNQQSHVFDTRAQIHWLKGDYQAALDDYDTAIHFHNMPLYHASRALTLDTMGREKEALDWWQEHVTEAIDFEMYNHAPRYAEAMQAFITKAMAEG